MNKFISNNKKEISQTFLHKKRYIFRIEKNNTPNQKDGRWTLKEHIQFLKALDKFGINGINWKKISGLIPSRTTIQIRSHCLKFFKKLKKCKDERLKIDFTARNIKNINDMIRHVKSVNKDYNIVMVFLYLSEKCSFDKNSQNIYEVNNKLMHFK